MDTVRVGYLRMKPRWDAYRGLPISFAMVWRADG